MDPHIHKNQKQVANRLARVEGQIRGVRQMVLEGRDCSEVLLQIAAVRKALDSAANRALRTRSEGESRPKQSFVPTAGFGRCCPAPAVRNTLGIGSFGWKPVLRRHASSTPL